MCANISIARSSEFLGSLLMRCSVSSNRASRPPSIGSSALMSASIVFDQLIVALLMEIGHGAPRLLAVNKAISIASARW